MAEHPVYARISGPIVMVGFGSIGKGTLPMIERHLAYDKSRITVLDPKDTVDTHAYGVFANGGFLVQPYFIRKIVDDRGNPLGIANPQRALEVAGDLVVGGTISGGAGSSCVSRNATGASPYSPRYFSGMRAAILYIISSTTCWRISDVTLPSACTLNGFPTRM